MIGTTIRVTGDGYSSRAAPWREMARATTWQRRDVRPPRGLRFERQRLHDEVDEEGTRAPFGTACDRVNDVGVECESAVARRHLPQFHKPAEAMHAESLGLREHDSASDPDRTKVITVGTDRREGGW